MKRIGVSQRVDAAAAYSERRDGLDQAWARLLGGLGLDLVPVPNSLHDVAAWAQRQSLAGLLLSGGNDLAHLPGASNPAPERDACERALLAWAEAAGIPVLGVCRGMQMMNCRLGGGLAPVSGHIACRHAVRSSADSGFFKDYEEVNSFHGWGIRPLDLAPSLHAQLWAEDDTVEAFRHERLPWFGIMWHPERDNGSAHAKDLVLLDAIFNQSEWKNS